ncbi:MAG TPA: alpha/beta hydrolase domain-containing protein [Myxococcaceae bacterium]|nr:alpha/beta hydrolase domain-containing protein [Myxococcaceae bacterium]
MSKSFLRCAAILLTSTVSFTAQARVVRFIVEQTRIFADGTSFGSVGQYERLDGTAYMEVDPSNPLDANIVDIEKATNERGVVEFTSPFFILKPVNMELGNGKIFYTINNRGNKGALNVWNFAASNNDPISAADAGDGYLMRLGYTIVDAGWQGDVAPGNARLFPNLPVARRPDGPIGSLIRIEYSDRTIPQDGTFTLNLEGSPNFVSWEAGDLNTANANLTVRDDVVAPKVPIPSDQWAFGTCPTGPGSLVQTSRDICLFDGFQPDKLYELIYWAINPKVMGLGYAITRDIGSFLRYQTQDDEGNRNPLALSAEEVGIRREYSWGSSSTGMYQRDFLYLGFNEDESHRKVFDAAWINIPGSQRLFANVEFADPNTYSREDDRHDFLSTSYPPLTYAVRRDEISGIEDGILKRPDTDPLVIHTDTESEFYRFRGSLNLTNAFGEHIDIPSNVRIYLNSNFQHGNSDPTATFPGPRGICQNMTNPNYYGPTYRALLLAMDMWADQGIEPPPSNAPNVRDGTLVTPEEVRASYPAIPGLQFPPPLSALNELELLDFGPNFGSQGGWIERLMPGLGPRYTLLVPKTDSDGLDLAGFRQMEVRVPLGTNAGWNVRAEGFRAPHSCGLSGSFFPFANTRAERIDSGDPRPSLEERYGDHRGYVEAVRDAGLQLMREGFLISEDWFRYVAQAESSDVLR